MTNVRKLIALSMLALATGAGAAPAAKATTVPAATQPDVNALLHDPMMPKYSEEFARKQAKTMEAIAKYGAGHSHQIKLDELHERQQKRIYQIETSVLAVFFGVGAPICVATKRKA